MFRWLFVAVLVLGTVCAWAAQPPQRFPINYTLERSARISLLVTDAKGAVVRELLHAAPRAKGAHSEPWDGLDEHGKPVPAGTYTWKLLATDGLQAEYLLTLGTNPTPAYDTWPGNHGSASATAVDATGLYVAGGCGEGDPLLIKQDFTGKRLWAVPHWLDAWMGGYSLGVAGGKVYLLQQNGVVQCIDAATGAPQARWDVIWADADRQDGKDIHLTMDLAARDAQLVVSYADHNAVRWLDPASGKTLDEAVVPKPLSLALDAAGRVLVISGDAVVALTRAEKTPTPLITGLTAPWRLDVDAHTGDILVAERGNSQQVKRFSADGKLLAAYGTPGGRPRQGRYDPNGFADIDDLAAGPDGGFIIIEAWTAPRRTAQFSRDGVLVREWYGGQQYANTGAADPADPRFVWIESHWGNLIQCKVDYVKRTWEVYATYTYGGLAEGMVADHAHGHSGWLVRRREGHLYLVRETGFPCILEVDEANRRLVPKVVVSILPSTLGWKDLPIVQQALARPGAKAPGANLSVWLDRNNDGNVQLDEITGEVAPALWGSGHLCYGEDFTVYTPRVNTWGDRPGVTVIPVKEWLPGGVPVYGFGNDLRQWQKYPDEFNEMQTWGAAQDHHGNLFVACDTNTFKPFGVGGGGGCGGNRVVKYGPDGTILWTVGRHAPASVAKPGEVKSFYSTESVHDCVVASDYSDSMIHVWDQDGLWVGRLLEQPNLTVAPRQAYELCGENFGNSVFEVPTGMKVPGLRPGDVLLFGGGQNNTPVYKITGWDTFRRKSGTLTITPAQAATLTARVTAEQQRSDVAHIPYLREVKLDGDLSEWQQITPLEILDGAEVRAKVYLAWNNSGLYAAYAVKTDAPWQSASTPTLAFQGGAAVDINLGPLLPERKLGGSGDLRVVAAPLNGKATAVEFLPLLAPGMGDDQRAPATYETGNGKITFARAAALPADWVAAGPRPATNTTPGEVTHTTPQGYVVELRIPFRAPLELRPGFRFRLDASVILADPDGRRAALRIPWHSRDDGDRTTQDTYFESLLRPAAWGEAVLE